MQIVIFTAGMMWKRAVGLKSNLWLCGAIAVSVLILAPADKLTAEFVSLALTVPVVFLLTGWNGSATRKGLMTLMDRSNTFGQVRFAELAVPVLAASVTSSAAVFAFSSSPPWQFWVVAPLTTASLAITFALTEQYAKHAGRSFLAVMWLLQLTTPAHTDSILNLVLFQNYPAAVLLADPGAGMRHPDSYVLASLVVVFLVSGINTLLRRRNG